MAEGTENESIGSLNSSISKISLYVLLFHSFKKTIVIFNIYGTCVNPARSSGVPYLKNF